MPIADSCTAAKTDLFDHLLGAAAAHQNRRMAASQELRPLIVIFMRLLHERTKCARDGLGQSTKNVIDVRLPLLCRDFLECKGANRGA